MKEIMPRPVLLAVTLMLVVGAVVFIELRLDTPGADATSARSNVEKQPKDAAGVDEKSESRKDAPGDIKKVATGPSNDTEISKPVKRDTSAKQRPKSPTRSGSRAKKINIRGLKRSQALQASSTRKASR